MIKASGAMEREIFVMAIEGKYRAVMLGYGEQHIFAQVYLSVHAAIVHAKDIAAFLNVPYTGEQN